MSLEQNLDSNSCQFLINKLSLNQLFANLFFQTEESQRYLMGNEIFQSYLRGFFCQDCEQYGVCNMYQTSSVEDIFELVDIAREVFRNYDYEVKAA